MGKQIINLQDEYSDYLNEIFNELVEASKKCTEPDIMSIFKEIEEAGFAYEQTIKKNSIIWVGIGCAFNNKNKKEASSGEEDLLKDGKGIFIDDKHKEKFQYYQSISKFFSEIEQEQEYSTLDLTSLRITDQDKIKKILKMDFFVKYFNKNIDLFKKVIQQVKPKMIIIGNAFVRDELQNRYIFEFNEKRHCWFCKDILPIKDIPVFFTSMLSGQRALDIGSRELLKSVVKYNLKISK